MLAAHPATDRLDPLVDFSLACLQGSDVGCEAEGVDHRDSEHSERTSSLIWSRGKKRRNPCASPNLRDTIDVGVTRKGRTSTLVEIVGQAAGLGIGILVSIIAWIVLWYVFRIRGTFSPELSRLEELPEAPIRLKFVNGSVRAIVDAQFTAQVSVPQEVSGGARFRVLTIPFEISSYPHIGGRCRRKQTPPMHRVLVLRPDKAMARETLGATSQFSEFETLDIPKVLQSGGYLVVTCVGTDSLTGATRAITQIYDRRTLVRIAPVSAGPRHSLN